MDADDGVAKREPIDALQKLGGTSPTIRSGTKLAAIIDAMRHPAGATIAQMMAGTGWQAHTVRGAISGMVRKKPRARTSSAEYASGFGRAGISGRSDSKRCQGCAQFLEALFVRPNFTVAVLPFFGLW
jgi:hypothetical protein